MDDPFNSAVKISVILQVYKYKWNILTSFYNLLTDFINGMTMLALAYPETSADYFTRIAFWRTKPFAKRLQLFEELIAIGRQAEPIDLEKVERGVRSFERARSAAGVI